ncbi:hypothetical protein PUN28_008674 [Cardiocondyla obscurior]|uniref:Uncharacterized protein n=1 Tax=Cardiocondyla obscurior TaxID=286306 RepID=A0AAW2G0T1_9HYME
MRELSLSFVCVEPIPPRVSGACALMLFKGRDELFRAALAYAANSEPRHYGDNKNSRPRARDCVENSRTQRTITRVASKIKGTRRDARVAPGKRVGGSTLSIRPRR